MHNGPCPWYHPRWCPDMLGHDLQMRVPKMPVARDSFPSFATAQEIALLHARDSSGRCPQRQTAEFAASLVEQFMPTRNLRRDVSRRGSVDCSRRRERTANVENVRNVDIKQCQSRIRSRPRSRASHCRSFPVQIPAWEELRHVHRSCDVVWIQLPIE